MAEEHNLIALILITVDCQLRWQRHCFETCIEWAKTGHNFDPSEVGDERIVMRDGKMVICTNSPAGRTEMVLEPHEWRWKPGIV